MKNEAKRRIFFVGGVLVILSCALFVFRSYQRHALWFPGQHFPQRAHPLVPEDIQLWMTFEYINFVFKLPPEYLRQELSIEDSRYPHITLGRLSGRDEKKASSLLLRVQDAVRNHE